MKILDRDVEVRLVLPDLDYSLCPGNANGSDHDDGRFGLQNFHGGCSAMIPIILIITGIIVSYM